MNAQVQRIVEYLDLQVAIALHDPEGVRDEQRAEDCMGAANIVENSNE